MPDASMQTPIPKVSVDRLNLTESPVRGAQMSMTCGGCPGCQCPCAEWDDD